jgi:hypothetical protein
MWRVRLALKEYPRGIVVQSMAQSQDGFGNVFSFGIKSGLALFGFAVFPDDPAENCIVVFLGHKVSSVRLRTPHLEFLHLHCRSDTIFFKPNLRMLRGSRSGTAYLKLTLSLVVV